jgi:integrase
LKGLQWCDVDLFASTLTIRKSKTAAGERVVPLTGVALSALARLRGRAEGFGAVEPSHYVFAAFVPKFTFSGKKVIDYNVTGFDPTRHLRSWRNGLEDADEESATAGVPVPRSAALRHYSTRGERNVGFNHHGDCRTREPSHVGAVQPCADGGEADSDGNPRCEHQKGGL